MKRGLRRIGAVIGVGLVWAAAWAPLAVLIGLAIVDPDNSMDEMWVAIGAYPGFVSGVLFALAAGIGGGRRTLSGLSLRHAAGIGALCGLAVGVFPFAVGEATTALPLWQLASAVAGTIVVLSMLSAVVSAVVSRSLDRRRAAALPMHARSSGWADL